MMFNLLAPATISKSFGNVTLRLLEGFSVTCELFIITLLVALPLGLLISFCSMSKIKPIKILFRFIIWVIRGTPLMLQLLIIYYLPALLFGFDLPSAFLASIIGLIINYACYFSEIFRSGIESIPHGQYEAGKVLGMKKGQIFSKVVLLQVIKVIVPPMSNEIITLVKDTALVRVLLVTEILYEAEKFTAYGLIWPLFYTGVYYLLFVGILTIIFGRIEKKLSYFKA